MTHAECAVKLCIVTKNTNDIYARACMGKTPLLNMFKHVPPSNMFEHVLPPNLSIKSCQEITSFNN